jgi:hypothetical protein
MRCGYVHHERLLGVATREPLSEPGLVRVDCYESVGDLSGRSYWICPAPLHERAAIVAECSLHQGRFRRKDTLWLQEEILLDPVLQLLQPHP